MEQNYVTVILLRGVSGLMARDEPPVQLRDLHCSRDFLGSVRGGDLSCYLHKNSVRSLIKMSV